MKTVIFSDTHLTEQFDPKLCLILEKIIAEADRVIINGDFWDGYLTDFNSFVNSEWQRLFPVLKEKQAVYIYGNHDEKWMSDDRVNLFSVLQGYEYTFYSGQKKLKVFHGQKLFSSWVTNYSQLLPFEIVKRVNCWLHDQQARQTVLGKITHKIETSFDVSGDGRVYKYISSVVRPRDEWWVLGHTHLPRYSDELKYLNSGKFTLETPTYLFLQNETFTLRRE